MGGLSTIPRRRGMLLQLRLRKKLRNYPAWDIQVSSRQDEESLDRQRVDEVRHGDDVDGGVEPRSEVLIQERRGD